MTNSNPLLRRSQPARIAENLYERFELRENPFPDSPTIVPDSSDPRRNGEIYCADLRAHEQNQFERLLIPRMEHENRLIALLMDYATRRGRGIGKTAFLNHQRRRIMADLGDELTDGAYVLLAAHLIPEGGGRTRKFWQFVRLVAQTMNESKCISWAIWRLRAVSGLIPDDVLAEVDPRDPAPTLGNDQWLRQRGIEVTFALNSTVAQRLIEAGVREEVARSLAQGGHAPEDWKRQFLDHQTDYRWRQEGHLLVFDDLVRLFQAADIRQTLLLVDEVEKIVVPQNRQERRTFVDELRRHFVDGPFQNVYARFYGLLLTIHPYVQELWAPHWQASGLDRVCALSGGMSEEYTIYFNPLNAADAAVPLVLAYLDHFRIIPDQRGQLAPFDQESVVEALRLSGGVPGPMLTLLRLVLEQAIREGWGAIRVDQVRTVYETAVPIEPLEEDVPGRLPPARVDLIED
ncbi:MAG TPA: hypothetical protein ENN99_16505 [Chloroflexi bacterium]|nr:hypothetical protein [Chloroflexota bacterium]